MNNYKLYILCFGFLCFSSCKKMIEVGAPKTQLTTDQVFKGEQSATAVISNIYYRFYTGISSNLSSLISLYVDDITTSSIATATLEFRNGSVSVINTGNLNIWRSFYSIIYECNSLIDNISGSSNISEPVSRQLKAEALFLRSLSYFYLVNLYGDVPLVLKTDVKITASLGRTSASLIYGKITEDLEEAKDMLSDSYPSAGRVRVNRSAVTALLARVYLYQEQWANAETESSLLLAQGVYSLNNNLNETFIKNNKETILEFWTKQGYTTLAPLFIPSSSAIPTYPVSTELLNSFEINDHRKVEWIHSVENSSGIFYFPFKYKNRTAVSGSNEEYLIVFRLSEQYLIRAEAKAHQNKIPEALEDLNKVRVRAGLPELVLSDKDLVLSAIEQERRVELFCEWGHRFFDLKRYGHLDILAAIKPDWKNTSGYLPIPQNEILNNPNLTQNPGY